MCILLDRDGGLSTTVLALARMPGDGRDQEQREATLWLDVKLADSVMSMEIYFFALFVSPYCTCATCWAALWHLDALCYEGCEGHGSANGLPQPRMELAMAERSHEKIYMGWYC